MSKKKTETRVRTSNPEFSKAMHALRSSSAVQPHTPESRKGSRAAHIQRAIRDQITY